LAACLTQSTLEQEPEPQHEHPTRLFLNKRQQHLHRASLTTGRFQGMLVSMRVKVGNSP
jgi:hypothetical protein